MNQNNITIKSRSKEKALQEAAKVFNVPIYKLEYESKRSLLGALFGSCEYTIWVVGANGTKKTTVPHKRKREGASVDKRRSSFVKEAPQAMDPKDISLLEAELKDFCHEVCSRLVEDITSIETSVDEVFGQSRLTLDVKSKQFENIISENSKVAESLEHILRKKPRHLKRELPFRIMVDANGTRKIHETELKQVAGDISEKVSQNNRPIVLNYKSAYDRKIIHLALDGNQQVSTRSVGSGASRRLMVVPKGYSGKTNLSAEH